MFCGPKFYGFFCLLCVIAWITFLFPGMTEAKDDGDIVIGKTVTLKSKILNEDRDLLINKVIGPDSKTCNCPIIFVLDGETHFNYVSSMTAFLVQQGMAPGLLVVGIKNTDRYRDFTFLKDGKNNSTGGGDAFTSFIEKEVFPYIEKNASTSHYRILFGHSLGGMFAIHTMTHNPDLFQAYFAISPYLQYGEGYLLADLKSAKTKLPEKPTFLSISRGDESELIDSYGNLEMILGKLAPATLTWKSEVFPDEDHTSLTPPSFYSAMRKLFKGWRIDKQTMARGIEAIDGHYKSLSERFGYTIATPEWVLNYVGYTFIQAGQGDDAILIFTENIRRYPGSANAYDSLGEAYEIAGQLAEAEKNFEIAIKLAKEKKHPFLKAYKDHLNRVRETKNQTK